MTVDRRSTVELGPVLSGVSIHPERLREGSLCQTGPENIDMPDQDQIIDRASVGDYQLHLSESQTLEVLQIAPHVLNGDIGPHPMGLQKVVEFVTRLKAQ